MPRKGDSPSVVPPEDAAVPNAGRGEDPSSTGTDSASRVIYIGQLPHGFYEEQLKEFQSAEVAAIAAEAMDNYMMFKQKLRVHVIKSADLHPLLFKGANRKFRAIPRQKLSRDQHNRERTAEEEQLRVKKVIAKDKRRQQRIKAAGIDYQYEPLQAQIPAKSTHKKFK